jgi:hypothetical protein
MNNFVAFILTHGRPDRVLTYKTLRSSGYTGPVVLLIDNEDHTVAQYRERYGDQVRVFDKRAISDQMDEGDNSENRKTIVYARNACWEIARELGYSAFVQLDDDYTEFRHKINHQNQYIEGFRGASVCPIKSLDAVWAAMVEFLRTTPVSTIAMAQGGDFIGGADGQGWIRPKRKAMNSFVCLTDRPFQFLGRVNEDVNTYTHQGSRGTIFLSLMWLSLQQVQTQAGSGGMTDIYLNSGTYVKSFYSVLYQPSSVSVSVMMSRYPRLHHRVDWRHTVPKILRPPAPQ